MTGYELLWLIYLYSFFGWCLEVCLAALRRKTFVNRGILNAPFCMLYGFSAAAFALFLPELKDRPVFLFLGGAVLASFLEYWSGRLIERIFHRKWWDYSGHRFHLDGYVCLTYSAIWGLGAVLMIKGLNALLLAAVGLIPHPVGVVLLWILTLSLAADALGSAGAILELRQELRREITPEELLEVSSRQAAGPVRRKLLELSVFLNSRIARRIQRRMMKAYPNISLKNLREEQKREKARSRVAEAFVFGYGCSLYKLVSLFFIGAFLGDVVETVFVYYTAGVLMSRSSVVYGPFSIVWGLGCVMLTAVLYRVRNTADRHIFLAGTVLGGAYEYFCSVFTELVFGTIFWDYSEIPFNLGGRINLLYCFFWGIVAVVWLKGIYPVLSRWIEKIPVKAGKIVTNLLIVFMLYNMLLSGMALARYTQRQAGEEPAGALWQKTAESLDEHFPDERIEKIYPNLVIVD